jgi:putative ABC transport system substrate-binding protein
MPNAIGFLGSTPSAGFEHLVSAFRHGLDTRGHDAARDTTIVESWAGGDYRRLNALAKNLVGQNVELLVAAGGIVSALAAIDAARPSGIPVLYVVGRDPSRDGITNYPKAVGINVKTSDLIPVRHDELKAAIGGNSNIFLLVNPGTRVASDEKPPFGGKHAEASSPGELHSAFKRFRQQNVAGVVVSADPFFNTQRQTIVDLAAKFGIPASYPWTDYVEAGGLISRGSNLRRVYLKLGATAAELLSGTALEKLDPQLKSAGNTELAINLRASRALELEIPFSTISNADILIH